jgi:SAM-dependent MidA family methyltransferase
VKDFVSKAQLYPADSSDRGNPNLVALITEQIVTQPDQRVAFAKYMDWVLYHPNYGYYSKKRDKIGAQGDFFTSPHLTADFGELIAEQLAQFWQILGEPNPFTLVEMGAGQGLLAADVIQYLYRQHPTCFASLQYLIIEKAAAHITEQKHRLQRWRDRNLRIDWATLEEIPPDSITGCVFSNELVDAFPVHLVTLQDSSLKEIYVDSALNEVVEDVSTPELSDYFNFVGVDLSKHPNGYRTEINLTALNWMNTVSDRLHRGFVLTVDYGYSAERYYNWARSQGTLQCYYQHRHHNDPYVHIGEQDITAHVDFTALQRQGEKVGLETVGFTQQGLFLMALGMGDRLGQIVSTEATSIEDLQERLQRRDALHQLINPLGLGGFGVLIQRKGLTEREKLRSLKGLEMQSFS